MEILDLTNYRCPQTIIALKKIGLRPGTYLACTMVMDTTDLAGWCHRSGHRLVDVVVKGTVRETTFEVLAK